MTYTNAQIAEQVQEKLCQRHSYQRAPLAGEAEMVVRWPISHNKYQQVVAFLDRWPVGDVYQGDATPTAVYVDDPTVEHESYAGRWRIASNWYNATDFPGYVLQTRRLGLLEAVVDGDDLKWDEARLVSGRDHTVFKSMDAEDPDAAVAGETDDYVVFEWRGVDPELMPSIVRAMVALADGGTKTFAVFGDQVGAHDDWRMLPPQYREMQDGSGTITAAFVRFGVTITDYSSVHGEVTTETVTEAVTEDQAQARIESIKTDESGLHSVSASRGRESGIAMIRYSKLIPNPGLYTYEVTTEWNGDTAQHTEYHKIAWEQAPGEDGQIDVDYTPSGVSFTNKRARVSSVRRNPYTQRYSYHVVVWDDGEQISSDSESPTTSYRISFDSRSRWSISNMMYWDQTKVICYAHQMCTFSTFDAANAWIGGAAPNPPSYTDNGVPIWTNDVPGNFATADTPMPRLVGKKKWLASRRIVSWQTDWYPYEPA